LMPARKDALVPAAIMIELAETLARNSGSPDTVATVGICDVHPSAINSIPRTVTISFDVRDTDLETRERIVAALKARGAELAAERELGYELTLINADPPVTAADEIRSAIEASSAQAGLTTNHQVSRAYHDALFIARKVPTGMIFIPSKDGISHRPDEYTAPEEVANGVTVLAATLARLAE
ncbi:MAG: M20/M25/M40 family metallo-hydrolase, partial [Pseudomonadota bacterium]